MSYTKALKKRLPTMSDATLACEGECLKVLIQDEKNVAVRSSYRERIDIIRREQARRKEKGLQGLVKSGSLQKALNN